MCKSLLSHLDMEVPLFVVLIKLLQFMALSIPNTIILQSFGFNLKKIKFVYFIMKIIVNFEINSIDMCRWGGCLQFDIFRFYAMKYRLVDHSICTRVS